MAQVLSMGQKAVKFCVARACAGYPQYLMIEKGVFKWTDDIHSAMQFAKEKYAEDMASRVAGGAKAAEMVEV